MVAPCDNIILRVDEFRESVEKAFEFIEHHDTLLTFGVKPTHPETRYGYIQQGEEMEGNFATVKTFTEKPDADLAKVFVDSGEFYWNTGMFLSNITTFIKACEKLFVELTSLIKEKLRPEEVTPPNLLNFLTQYYSSFPNLSIDYGVLERLDNVCVMKCYFGWADLGTWHSIYECLRRGEDDNVVIDSNVILENCKQNVIRIPKEKLAVINGLEGFIVAEHDNVLLICKKGDTSGLMRKYVNEVQMKFGPEFI